MQVKPAYKQRVTKKYFYPRKVSSYFIKKIMHKYNDLKTLSISLIKEAEDAPIIPVKVLMTTTNCVLVEKVDTDEKPCWKLKEDTIYQVVDTLNKGEQIEYENFYVDPDEPEDFYDPFGDEDDE